MSILRIAETAAQTRGLDEYRQLDQEARAQSLRMGAQATAHKIEESHQEVEESHRAVESRNEEEHPEQRRRETAPHETPEEAEEKKPPRPPLESAEGHLLDVTA